MSLLHKTGANSGKALQALLKLHEFRLDEAAIDHEKRAARAAEQQLTVSRLEQDLHLLGTQYHRAEQGALIDPVRHTVAVRSMVSMQAQIVSAQRDLATLQMEKDASSRALLECRARVEGLRKHCEREQALLQVHAAKQAQTETDDAWLMRRRSENDE